MGRQISRKGKVGGRKGTGQCHRIDEKRHSSERTAPLPSVDSQQRLLSLAYS